MNLSTIGKRIKQRRKELKMSVDQLAEILGKNRATIYRYESDDIENMPLSVLEPLARALKVTPAYLMGWEDDQKDDIQILAAHHEGEDWTEEELAEIERFKEFVRMKRKQKQQE